MTIPKLLFQVFSSYWRTIKNFSLLPPLPKREQEIIQAIKSGNVKLARDGYVIRTWICGNYIIEKSEESFSTWKIISPDIRYFTRRGKLATIKALREQRVLEFQIFTVRNALILLLTIPIILSIFFKILDFLP